MKKESTNIACFFNFSKDDAKSSYYQKTQAMHHKDVFPTTDSRLPPAPQVAHPQTKVALIQTN